MRFARPVLRVTTTVLAMSGWRIDRLTWGGVLGGAGSFALARVVVNHGTAPLTLAYFATTVALYYGGNTALLGSPLPRAWIARLGEERAFQRYETLLALMFINQGLGLAAVAQLPGFELPVGAAVALASGLALAAMGLVVKVWATIVLGIDVYYYKDLFLGRPVTAFVARGPYRVLANPMYGLGQLHAYGWALANRSSAGLAAAALCHALIYVFYFAVEKPFVARVLRGEPTA